VIEFPLNGRRSENRLGSLQQSPIHKLEDD
jgi:hypothetical protein